MWNVAMQHNSYMGLKYELAISVDIGMHVHVLHVTQPHNYEDTHTK